MIGGRIGIFEVKNIGKEFRISLGESIESFAEGVNRVKEVRGEHVLVRVGSDLSAMASDITKYIDS